MAILEDSLPSDWVALTWEIEKDGGVTTVRFHGELDENADFSALRAQLEGTVIFHLEHVRRINSCGVREWVNFVRDLDAVSDLTFTHCSTPTVTQLNMIYNFRGNAKIRSVYAPYICESCEFEQDMLLVLETEFPGGDTSEFPEFRCENCDQPMVFDDIPDRYLAFLMDV